MSTELQILQRKIEVDKDSTVQAYTKLSVSCTCGYCRNFLAAYQDLSQDCLTFLSNLGIDPAKPAEIVEYNNNGDGTHYYGWWYHAVGQITGEGEINTEFASEIKMVARAGTDLVPPDFPRPVIQIEFFANIPWVLMEQP